MKTILCALNAKYIHSALGIRYLKNYAQSCGHQEVTIREFSINELPSFILSELYEEHPDVLCFSCYIWNIELTLSICRQLHMVLPETLLVLGGPEVSYDSAQLLKEHSCLSVIIRGEGEESFAELLDCLQRGQALETVQGISYRRGSSIFHNDDRPTIRNLDKIPFPYEGELQDLKDRIVYYESSRGCPFRCAYCLSAVTREVRYFPMDRVIGDLEQLVSHQVREIKFVDRTFNCNEKRAMAIMDFFQAHESDTQVHFEVDASLLSEQMMNYLDQVTPGRFYFEIGIQSTHLPALQAVHRSTDWDRIQKNVKRLVSQKRIRIHLDLIAGLPYEGYEDFHRSFNEVYQLGAEVIQLGFLKLLKGSPLRNEADLYQYSFQPEPPYQVLQNAFMSYGDILMLQRMEDLLDKYHNRRHISQTTAYYTGVIYQGDAFSFFEDLARYWNIRRLYGRGHRMEKLYQYLLEFTLEFHPEYRGIVHDLLKYDYLCNNHKYTLPEGLRAFPDLDQDLHQLLNHPEIRQRLDPQKIQGVRELRKRVHLEYFRYHPYTGKEENLYILFVYSSGGTKGQAVFITPDEMKAYLAVKPNE